jgi:ribosome recycling factor
VKHEAEFAKVAIRNIRKDINEGIKKAQKDGVPEDDAKTAETQVQKTTDAYIKKIDELTAAKEADLMHV